MAYLQQADIEAAWGVENVARWSQLSASSTSTTPDSTRIATAIQYAEAVIEDRLRGSYQTPLQASNGVFPPAIINIAAKFAGVWLYRARREKPRSDGAGQDDRVFAAEDEARQELSLYAAGTRRLELARRYPTATAPFPL